MKKTASILLFAAFAAQLHAVQMASQPWVTNRIDAAKSDMAAEVAAATNALYATVEGEIMAAHGDAVTTAANYVGQLRDEIETGNQVAGVANNAHQAAALKDWNEPRTMSAGEVFAKIDSKTTTNDVCAIVTNEVRTFVRYTDWELYIEGDRSTYDFDLIWTGSEWYAVISLPGGTDDFPAGGDYDSVWLPCGIIEFRREAIYESRNVLGLAREEDLNGKQDALPYPTNAIPYSAISGTPEGVTPQVVTNIIRDISRGGIWDDALQVWWTPVMRNGSLTYQATTNVNLNAED